MSDDNIRAAFALDESENTASALSLPTAQERARQAGQRRQALFLSSTGLITAATVLAVLSYRSMNPPLPGAGKSGMAPRSVFIGGPAISITPAPTPTPSSDWLKMIGAYTEAKTRGIYLDITYPPGGGKRRVWQKGELWRDDTPLRVYGFDGTREWVWLRKKNKVITWLPGKMDLRTAKYAGDNYTQPHLLRFLKNQKDDTKNQKDDSLTGGPSMEGKELWWHIAQNGDETSFSLDPKTYLPLTEEYTQARQSYGIGKQRFFSVSTFGSTRSDETFVAFVSLTPPPSFMTFPRTASPNQGLAPSYYHNPDLDQPTPLPTGEPNRRTIVHTVKVSYGVLPSEGFAPPKGAPIADLDSIAATWEARLKSARLAVVESLRYQAVIRHASRDSQGNVYLIYTGNTLQPEVFRTKLKITIELLGYDTISWYLPVQPTVGSDAWPSDLSTILPKPMGDQPPKQLTLMPLKPGAPAAQSITLRITEAERGGETRTKDIRIPLVYEPDGPACMTAISGPPTAAIRNTARIQTLRAAVARVAAHEIEPDIVTRFETLARENWANSPPWEAALYLALLAEAGGQQGKASQHAASALNGYQKAFSKTSPTPEEEQEYNALRRLLTRLEK